MVSHHHRSRNLRLRKSGLGKGDVFGTMVGPVRPAAQDELAIGVSPGSDGGGTPILGDAEKSLALGGGYDSIDCGLEIPSGRILEADRHGETGSHLAVGLGFRVRAPMAAQQRESAR